MMTKRNNNKQQHIAEQCTQYEVRNHNRIGTIRSDSRDAIMSQSHQKNRLLPLLLLLALALIAVLAADNMDRVDAVPTWRMMRTDKKAMRNSLVRFGKRAYRPAGEAFVSAVDLVAPVAVDPLAGSRLDQPIALRSFYDSSASPAAVYYYRNQPMLLNNNNAYFGARNGVMMDNGWRK